MEGVLHHVTFFFGPIGQGVVTWPSLTAGSAGKCSLYSWQPSCFKDSTFSFRLNFILDIRFH